MTHPIERKIVRDLAACLIAAGMPVTVDHPEEEGSELEASTDLDAIEQAAFQFVDGIWLLARKAENGKYDSWIRIIFGNEAECINDYSTDLQPVIQPVLDWCESPTYDDAALPALAGIVRELIFGDGTDASLQRTIDLCIAAQKRFDIKRVTPIEGTAK